MLSFAFIGCSSDSDSSGTVNGGGETAKFKCENCNAEYTTKALADACDKEYGCPEFDLAKNKDRVYYCLQGIWMSYDKSTGEINQSWMPAELIMEESTEISIPAVSYKQTLDAYDLGDDDNISFDQENDADEYNKMLGIINDPTTKKYTIDYLDVLPFIQIVMPYKFTEDIKTAFKNKAEPVLPEQFNDHNLLYYYMYKEADEEDEEEQGAVYIIDIDDMKMYEAEDPVSTDNNITLYEDDEDDPISISGRLNFPDTSSKQVVENPAGYSLIKYDSKIELGKVLEGIQIPVNSQIFVDKDGKYFINFLAG